MAIDLFKRFKIKHSYQKVGNKSTENQHNKR